MHRELNDFYNSLDLFVLPSYWEAFGCVYTEAYACGVPFIAVKGQGISELIPEKDVDKWLIDKGDFVSLSDKIENYIENNFAETEHTKEKLQELVKNAIEYANMVVYEKSKEIEQLEGMGTTIEVALVHNNRVYIGHVGDSRIYRIRKNFIRKLTIDHSYVEKLVKDGSISRDEAMHHPKKNMLMN